MANLKNPRIYDAVVVGSGISGGWAAKELCEKGLETLVLEAGRAVDPERDYVEHVPAWEKEFRGLGDRERIARDQPIQKECYACDEWSSQFFVNDREHPYTHDDDEPFLWIRGRQVGGRSITWGRQVYRLSDLDFEANARDGHGVDWPIRYRDLAPWYDHVEDTIGVSGRAEGLAQLPDGRFLPPMAMNCAEEHVRDAIAGKWSGERTMTIGRCAVLTRHHRGRRACHYCAPCRRGCASRSYFNSVHVTLPAARATGRMTLRPWSVVHSLIYDEKQDRVVAARVIDARTGEDLEVRARVFFLCASALESARLLLNSKSRRFPTGLANGSGELGHNLMDHTMRAGAFGRLAGLEDRFYSGHRPNGIYIARFRNLDNEQTGDFLRGYGYQGSASRATWSQGLRRPGFGAAFKESLRTPAPWRMSLGGFGECLPRHENFVALDPKVTDAWGVPVLRISMRWGDNELRMRRDMAEAAAEMLEAAGLSGVETYDRQTPPGLTIHEMGTARMGRDPKSSVLNGWNQAHDVPNLFVTDGACMASSGCQNPSLTYMALTARAADYAVRRLADGGL